MARLREIGVEEKKEGREMGRSILKSGIMQRFREESL